VVCLHSLFDGFVMRHLMDEDSYALELLVDCLWDLAMGMTERGFVDDALFHDPDRAAFLRSVLNRSKGDNRPSSREIEARASGADVDAVKGWFLSDRSLSEAVLDVALAEVHDLRSLQASIQDLSPSLFTELLGRIEWVATEHSGLVRDNLLSPVWEEIRMLMVDAATRSIAMRSMGDEAPNDSDVHVRVGRALDAARAGVEGRGVWSEIGDELFGLREGRRTDQAE
jgi:hypothetical protein